VNFLTHRGSPYEYEETESGRKDLFSVSQIRKVMDDSMSRIPAHMLEAARIRGTLLHQRFWKMLAWRAGLCSFPPLIAAYPGQCRAMDEWADKNNVLPRKLEEPSANFKLGYAGCADTQCLYGSMQILTITDLKSGGEQITDPAQLLAYDEMEGYRSEQLLDLYVHEDGSYTEEWVTKKDKIVQWPWFLSALNVLKGRRNHGIKF
jgi:hypothetical protein